MAMDITKGTTRVYIDPKRCIANAKCTTAAPGVYILDEETGVAVIANPDDATVEQLGRRVYPTILTPMFGQAAVEDGSDEE